MLTYTLRRLLTAIPTLILISLIIFLLLDLAPGDPTASLPLTIPPEVREQIRQSLGMGEPVHIRYFLWLKQMIWTEPAFYLHQAFGSVEGMEATRIGRWTGFVFGEYDPTANARLISWQTRAPVLDTVFERLPQTLLVVGLAYVVGVLIAMPIGIISAYRQYSVFDQAGTFVSMIGFSIPPFFSGVLMIILFTVMMPNDSFWWFPSVYNTTLVIDSWENFGKQVRQMVLPVMVLALQTTAQLSRFMRASMLDNLNQDYVRTARAKGMTEATVVLRHVLRNSMIPVVTVIALGIPAIFGGAIITEQIFKVNGIGQLLIVSIQGSDVPAVQTLTFIFAVLIVFFNLIADILYGILDPRIRYD